MAIIMGVNAAASNNILNTIRSFPPSLSLFSKSQRSNIRNWNWACKFVRKSAAFTTLNVSRNRNLRPTWRNGIIPDRFSKYDFSDESWAAATTSYDDGDYYTDVISNGGGCAVCESLMNSQYRSEFPSLLDWPERWETNRFRIEHKANRVEIPLSLRMIKKKKQLQTKTGGEVDCSVKKAFMSMVYIMGEIQNSAMQLKERSSCEDLKEVMSKVHGEMNDSFVWLFRQVIIFTKHFLKYYYKKQHFSFNAV